MCDGACRIIEGVAGSRRSPCIFRLSAEDAWRIMVTAHTRTNSMTVKPITYGSRTDIRDLLVWITYTPTVSAARMTARLPRRFPPPLLCSPLSVARWVLSLQRLFGLQRKTQQWQSLSLRLPGEQLLHTQHQQSLPRYADLPGGGR